MASAPESDVLDAEEAIGTVSPEVADALERRWRARVALTRPAVALTWLGLAAFVLHAGLVVFPLVLLATSDLARGGPPPGAGTAPPRWTLVTLQDVLAAASAATSLTWLLFGLALVTAGLALRAGTHRAAVQAAAVATLPLGALALAELAWLQPCTVLGAVLAGAFHLALALLGGWLALHLARPAGRDAFDPDPVEDPVSH